MAQDAGALHLPAFLVNPRNKSQAAVNAYNAQQAAHAQARRDARAPRTDDFALRKPGEGMRRLRRRENALIVHNPHAQRPRATDWAPPPPGHTQAFPLPAPRRFQAASAPSPDRPGFDAASAEAGQFSLSLKGVRQLMRKRGARAQVVVDRVEGELLKWMEGLEQGNLYAREHGVGQPKIVDATPSSFDVAAPTAHAAAPASTAHAYAATSDTSIPAASAEPTPFALSSSSSSTALSTLLDSFYRSEAAKPGATHNARPAIVELMRAPGHLIWAVADSFERLIVHILCRYYELASFSQTLPSAAGDDSVDGYPSYRITHIVLPARLQRPNTKQPDPGQVLLTPENSDFDTATETATEVGFSESEASSDIDVKGYHVPHNPVAFPAAEASDSDAESLLYDPTTPARGRGRTADATPTPVALREHSVESDSDWLITDGEPTPAPTGWTSSTSPQPLRGANMLNEMPSLTRTFTSDSAWAGSDTSDEGSLGSMMDSMTLEPPPQTHGAPANAPFVSQYNIPLDAGHLTSSGVHVIAPKEVLKHRVSFFEFLYG